MEGAEDGTVSVYVIADLDIKDFEELSKYAEKAPATVTAQGGRYLVRRGKAEVIEGNWRPKSLTVLEFPSWAAAKAWYNSEEYRRIIDIRKRAAPTDLVWVEGVPTH